MQSRIFSTPKGTDLPIMSLSGRDYLEVKYRLVWFREEHPDWSIETEFVHVSDKTATAKATIRDETGRLIATSHKSETASSFPDFMEKAETGAIGRALALIGYGTQFCADDLDEGDRIVDSPVSKRTVKHTLLPTDTPNVVRASSTDLGTPGKARSVGDFMITFGKKYYGKRLKDIPQAEIEGYIQWLDKNAATKNQGPSAEVTLLKAAVERLYHPERFAKGDSADEMASGNTEETSAIPQALTSNASDDAVSETGKAPMPHAS